MKIVKILALVSVLTAQAVQAQTDLHLYDTIQVNHHNLYFDIRDFKDHILYGKAELSVQSRLDGLKYVPLLLQQMQIDSILVDGLHTPAYQYNDTLLRIPLASSLSKGEKAKVTVVYHGKPIASSFGGFLFNDSLRMAHNMGASINDIPHSYGRGWFPAVDDFRSRSTFDLYFRVDNDLKAIGSGILKDMVPAGDNTMIWHWQVNQPIPEYLVNVAVGDYRKIEMEHRQTGKTLPIDIYVLPEEVEKAREAYAIVPKILEIMEKHFGEYAFDRVGYVSVNSPGGAMEHVGNISMPLNPTPTYSYQGLIIHELIHGWFGNKVTCATAGDMWLNEGITTFCPELVIPHVFFPDQTKRYTDNNMLGVLSFAPKYDGGYYPLQNMPVKSTYGITTYNKGAMVMHTLRYYLGDDLLLPALKAYLDAFAFRSVTTDEFKAFISHHTGKNLDDFFDLWVKQPGYPAFEIDSIVSTPVNGGYKETIFLEQKLCHAPEYGRNVRVPITLFDEEGKQSAEVEATVTGEKATFLVQTSFKPAYGIVNRNNDIAVASFTQPLQIDHTGKYPLRGYNMEIECKQAADTVNFYMQHYWVAPDALKSTLPVTLSDSHYWRLAGNIPSDCLLNGVFMADTENLDSNLLKDNPKEILLMYRQTPSDDWTELSTGSSEQKYSIQVNHLKPGEYCLAVRTNGTK